MKPKISIIIPVYNVEKYLEKCLNTVLAQTLKNIEIIVVNDGTKDNSQKIIDKYKKNDKRIVSLIKENGGQGSARNYGLEYATGEFVMFVDSDDYIDLQICEKMYNLAQKDNSDLVFCDYKSVDLNDNEIDVSGYKYANNNIEKLYLNTQFCPWAKIIKLSILKNNDLYFPNIKAYEDIACVPSWILYCNKVSYLNEKLYNYLIRPGSTMLQTSYNKKLEEIFSALTILKKRFIKEKKNGKYYNELEWIYIENLLHAASLRFFAFDNYESNLNKVSNIMKENFPNWYKNKYFKSQSLKYKVICKLFYNKEYKILKIILKK